MVLFALTIVRHGETSYNRKGIIQGQSDIPLSSVGHDQAKLVAKRLQKERFTHAISSDLSRAKETAEAIVSSNTASKCQLSFDERLRERKFGIYEGKPSKELMEAARKDSHHSWTEFNPSGGETVEELHNRAVTFFSDLCRNIVDVKSKPGKHLSESYSTSASTITKTKGNDRSFMSNKKTEIGDIILPGGFDGNNVDLTNVSNSHSMALGKDDNFIVFEEDPVTKNCVNSCQIIETKDLISRISTTESSMQNNLERNDINSQDLSGSAGIHENKQLSMADILIVSHGGLIKELVKFFVEKLECEIPDGSRLRICHNCSVSKFLVSAPCGVDSHCHPKVTCLFLNSKEHLQGMGTEFAEGGF